MAVPPGACHVFVCLLAAGPTWPVVDGMRNPGLIWSGGLPTAAATELAPGSSAAPERMERKNGPPDALLRAARTLWHLKNVGFSPARLGLLAGAIALMCIAGLAAMTLAFRATEAQRWVQKTIEIRQLTGELLQATLDAETGVRGYLLADSDTFLKPYRAAAPKIMVTLDQLRAMTSDNPPQSVRLQQIAQISEQLSEVYRQMLSLAARKVSGPKPSIWSGRVRENRSMDETRRLIAGLRSGRTRLAGRANPQRRQIAGDAGNGGRRCPGVRHWAAAVLRQDELRLRSAARFSHRRT